MLEKTGRSADEIEFNDEFESEVDICWICGSETATIIGYNEELDAAKFECVNCSCVWIERDEGDLLIKGKERNWEKFLSDNLNFPFKGVIDDYQEGGLLQYGDEVVVTKISGEDDKYGVMAGIRTGKLKRHFPIVDIAVADKKSPCYKILDDYRTWFANCR